MIDQKEDILIIGAGMVGLCLAYNIKKTNSKISILILDKEKNVGLHTSGRNSGVLHAGIYYEPNSLKAKVCVKGSRRLKKWCKEENIKILNCGKVIAPQTTSEDDMLDLLFDRGKKNGANVEIISKTKFNELIPGGKIFKDRALWTPDTCVVNPQEIMKKMHQKLLMLGVKFKFNQKVNKVLSANTIQTNQNIVIRYKYMFNSAGLNAVEIANKFDLARNKIVLPFKGLYWQLKNNLKYKIHRNLYPVPNLDLPFLGIHFTPTLDGNIILGPTAIPALGKENYQGTEGIELKESLRFSKILISQFLKNEGNFRKYSLEQANLGFKYNFWQSAKKLLPNLKLCDLERSQKVGIRPQVFDTKEKILINDFILEKRENSTHIVNAISPAFTASFELADLILKKSDLFESI